MGPKSATSDRLFVRQTIWDAPSVARGGSSWKDGRRNPPGRWSIGVVDGDGEPREVLPDQRLDLRPPPAGKAAADPRNVDRRPQLAGFRGEFFEAGGDGVVSHGGAGAASLRAVLADHVGDPD